MSKLTDDDRSMIEYFVNEKGDISRWSAWERRKPVIEAEHPELIDALLRVEIAERTLRAVVRSVVDV